MFKLTSCAFVVALALCAVAPLHAEEPRFSRHNAYTRAVAKTKDAIVNLKVWKDSGYGTRDIVGSGIIIDENGYVITNAHVASKATKIVATFADKTTASAELHVSLPKFDLAILKLNTKKKLKALTFASGKDLMAGETILAVGNPFGYGGTVTTGIISATERDIPLPTGGNLTNVIQHSAPINPGNSGGPLLNINGELIGINVALREGAQNMSFAINAETAKDVLAKYLSAKKVAGVSHSLKCDDAPAKDDTETTKVVVTSGTSSLKEGDVILTLAGKSVSNRYDVERALYNSKGQDSVEVRVLRSGKETKVSLELTNATTTVSTTGSRR